MKFSYSKMYRDTKPTEKEDLWAYQKMSNYYMDEEHTVKEIADLCGHGRAWRAGAYKPNSQGFSKRNAIGAWQLALDFDSCDFSPEEVCNYANEVIPPSFWYYSYSQGKKPGYNFRVVWCLEEMISVVEYEAAEQRLMKMFEEYKPDQATKDVSRLWFGGVKGATILNEAPVPLSTIGLLTVISKMEEGKTLHQINQTKGGFVQEYFIQPEEETVLVYGSDPWWEKLRGNCPLWDKYESGKYLNYNERFVLFTNLKYLKYNNGNFSVYRDIGDFYKTEVWKGHTFNSEQLKNFMMNKKTRPIPIVNTPRGKMTVPQFIKNYDEIFGKAKKCTPKLLTVEELDKWLDEKIPQFLERPGFEFFNSQVGSGKTERVIHWLKDNAYDKKIIYAAGTHKQKKEFADRCENADVMVDVLPKCNFTKKDLLLLQMGLFRESKQPDKTYFLRRMMDYDIKGIFVITHQLLSNIGGSLDADLIIVDEDFEDALISETLLTQEQLNSIRGYASDKEAYTEWVDKIFTQERGTNVDLTPLIELVLPNLQRSIDEYLNKAQLGLICSGVFNARKGKAKIGVSYGEPAILIKVKSPLVEHAQINNIPIKVFSATPKKQSIESIYGIEIPCVEAPLARHTGTVVQYTGITGAKGVKLSEVPNIIEYTKKVIPDKENYEVISFKDSEELWKNAGFSAADMHLQNCAGLDSLKGLNTIVAGKPEPNPQRYENWAAWEGITDTSRSRRIVEFNGVMQYLFTFNDERLQELHLNDLNYAIEQAIGRSRSLRTDAKTVVISNFITREVDEIVDTPNI